MTFLDKLRNSMLAIGIRKANATRIYNILKLLFPHMDLENLKNMMEAVKENKFKIKGIGRKYTENILAALNHIFSADSFSLSLEEYLISEFDTDIDRIQKMRTPIFYMQMGSIFEYLNKQYVVCGTGDIVYDPDGLKMNLILFEHDKIPKVISQPSKMMFSSDCLVMPMVKIHGGFKNIDGFIDPNLVHPINLRQPEMVLV